MPINVKKSLLKASSMIKRGNPQAAEQIYRDILEQFPQNSQAIKGLAALTSGGTLRTAGPAPSREQMAQLVAMYQTGRYEKALAMARQLADQFPVDPVILNFIGVVYAAQQRHLEAVAAYTRAIQLLPTYTEALCNQGISMQAAGQADNAFDAFDRAVELEPNNPRALMGRATTRRDRGDLEGAVKDYRLSLEIDPSNASAHNNLGNLLQYLGNYHSAVASYTQAINLNPGNADIWFNLGQTEFQTRHFDKSMKAYQEALKLDPGLGEARAKALHIRRYQCDWSAPETAHDRSLGLAGEEVNPFSMLSIDPDPAQQLIRATQYYQRQYGQIEALRALPPAAAERPEKIRIGYFSADFHAHATMYLMGGMLERHDRERFSIHAFSFGPVDDDPQNTRLRKAVDAYHDVRHMSEQTIAELSIAENIDIAVDLKGYTANCRPGIFGYRAAPIQISYLGYPGTLGMPEMDYIIGDETVTPAHQAKHYSEKIISLPNSYQANDNTREISTHPPSRESLGLPEGAFVFCCFNSNYKISSREFDIWMRLLSQVDNSVLWLLNPGETAKTNLTRAAESHGINTARLIFSEKLPLSEHLSRHCHADLFLDTFNCNAHTTASDALWAGLPVITRLGQGFASRVGGSLLRAVGLDELITESDEAYEQLALELARDADRLSDIRTRLEDRGAKAPLFDTARFTQDIEAAYEATYDRYLRGEAPEHITVPR
ncbi:tetratricopeptide repeat protein [Halioglobus maricola]|uniref:protein O-GlcNAc transferase n=1 Tax=Halioglobus maricola TaxID=2601894 RepID=A0A5P9NF70_9GAMM|nr:tetratricopeptide repeat protein [Halioglobus maricola]QFU74427.1 tetratricopeptide repeat protein [Halioglobus maricola]